MLGAATAIRATQATHTAQGVPRRSRRLQGQPPEFQRTDFKCHFCLRNEESCNPNVVYLSCCKHYVHYNCQAEWAKTSQTCAMCRQPCALGAPTPPVITNALILNRLRHLLESGELQRELQQVGFHSIAFNNVYGTRNRVMVSFFHLFFRKVHIPSTSIISSVPPLIHQFMIMDSLPFDSFKSDFVRS